jgi:hypothetical protein
LEFVVIGARVQELERFWRGDFFGVSFNRRAIKKRRREEKEKEEKRRRRKEEKGREKKGRNSFH